jgi:hypothetical protein
VEKGGGLGVDAEEELARVVDGGKEGGVAGGGERGASKAEILDHLGCRRRVNGPHDRGRGWGSGCASEAHSSRQTLAAERAWYATAYKRYTRRCYRDQCVCRLDAPHVGALSRGCVQGLFRPVPRPPGLAPVPVAGAVGGG